MKCVQSSDNGPSASAKKLVELKEPKESEKNEVAPGVVGQGQGRSEKGVFGVSENSTTNMLQSQPQPQGKVVCWERFLPVRSLKVLLVESDDSTRHVVSALLRNCSYEVTAVSNGIEAWKILQDLDNQIDLVLTEVVMSGLSGISLLSKIMTHKSCRNIPVIMMSCYDSMGIVLKCLSNGAADFLVKPIRKNELKNLWQHVWRRCHSSSGSGSESGVGNEKSMTAKSLHESGNDTGSNEEDDSISSGLQGRDGSDNGSGTQSSWTKRAAEVDSDLPDSTCAQVIYPRSEAFASSWMPASEECAGHDHQLEKISMGKDLKIGLLSNTKAQPKTPSLKVAMTDTQENQFSQLDLNLKNDGENLDKKLKIINDKSEGDEIIQAVNLPGDIVRTYKHSEGNAGSGTAVLPEPPRKKDKFMENVQNLPSVELGLNRLGDRTEAGKVSEQNTLMQSELSAFTRYNTCSTVNQGLTGNVGSCSPADNSSEAVKKPTSDCTPDQNSNNSSNNDMGSTTNRSFAKPASTIDKAPRLAFQPTKKGPPFDSELMLSYKAYPGPDNVKLQGSDMYSMRTAKEGGSLNSKGALTGADAVNCSLHKSVSGSNQGSNVYNEGSAAVNVEGMNMGDGSDVAGKDCANDGSGSGSGSGSGIGIEQSRSVLREAALNKFRQKRKERCFDKKVRYQSRKKVAEQRPRIRGQFVKQVQENKGGDAVS